MSRDLGQCLHVAHHGRATVCSALEHSSKTGGVTTVFTEVCAFFNILPIQDGDTISLWIQTLTRGSSYEICLFWIHNTMDPEARLRAAVTPPPLSFSGRMRGASTCGQESQSHPPCCAAQSAGRARSHECYNPKRAGPALLLLHPWDWLHPCLYFRHQGQL